MSVLSRWLGKRGSNAIKMEKRGAGLVALRLLDGVFLRKKVYLGQ